jgi:hypothetical protein
MKTMPEQLRLHFMLQLIRSNQQVREERAAGYSAAALVRMEERLIREYKAKHEELDCALLEHLTPGLRLVLAAEVAVGMLCPG